jgi:hypothetical protein
MRLHIAVDDELVAELDQRAGSRRRSAFIAELIRRGLDDERRWDDIEAALGSIPMKVTIGMPTPVSGFVANAPTNVASADVVRVLLDSTLLIDALRGRPAGDRLRALRRQGDEPWSCAISIEEIWRGLLPGEEANAQRLVRGLRCAPLGREVALGSGDGSSPDEASPCTRPAA